MRDQEERQTHGDPGSDSGEGAEVPVIWTSLLAWSDPVRCSARRPRGDFPLPAGVLHLKRHILRSRELRQAQDKAGMGSLTRADDNKQRQAYVEQLESGSQLPCSLSRRMGSWVGEDSRPALPPFGKSYMDKETAQAFFLQDLLIKQEGVKFDHETEWHGLTAMLLGLLLTSWRARSTHRHPVGLQ